MKIAIYAICLNEAKFVDRFMDACAGADYVVIADTGSTDGTAEMFRARGALVHQISIAPWRFDAARNVAMALIPADADVCFSLDIDEVPCAGWREMLEAGWKPEATRAQYQFVCSHLPDGSPGVQFLNGRLHQRKGYVWRHLCHEALYPDGIEDVCIHIPNLRVDHYPDTEKSRGFYLPMLQRAAAEDSQGPRMAHYLAREYFYNAQYDEAIAEFQRYLDMNGYFTSERVASMIYIGKCLTAQGKDPSPWLNRAIAEQPTNREPLVALAEHHYRQKEWPSCYAVALKALAVPASADGYMSDPRCYGATPDDLAALGAWYIGLHEVGLRHARVALQYSPDDKRLQDNVAFMEKFMADQQGEGETIAQGVAA